jgi:tRNA uridine 5-carbamoylmethylation protein Kti12
MHGQLIILVGLPSSGKSTIAAAIKDHLPNCLPVQSNSILLIDPDEWRGETDSHLDFSVAREPEIRQQTLDVAGAGLKSRKLVIVDDVNYYQSMRHDLLVLAFDAGVAATVIFVSTPLETCLAWNAARNYKVPPEVIRQTAEKFDNFARYAWDQPDFVIDPSNPYFSEQSFLDDLCQFLKTNRSPKLTPASSAEVVSPSPQSLKHQLDLESRRIVSDFLRESATDHVKRDVLKLRKSLLQKDPITTEELDDFLEAFQVALAKLK